MLLLHHRLRRWLGLRLSGASKRVDAAQRACDGFHRRGNGRQLGRLRLQLSQGGLDTRQRRLRTRPEQRAARPLDLMQRAHCLRDGCRQLE
jgi:hypothetical protein